MAKPKTKAVAKPARAATRCSQVVRLSKQQRNARLEFIPVKDCKCECQVDGRVQNVFKTKYRVAFRLDSVLPCDETDVPAILPAGCELLLEGAFTLRREQCTHDAQPSFFGMNEGNYRLQRAPGEVVFADSYCGTVGVNPSKSADERCCAHGLLLGSLCGTGTNALKGWTLCLSFDILVFILDRIDICAANSADARLNIDGVLVRPCPPR